MRTLSEKRLQRQRGSAFVEMALALMIFLTLMIGVIDVGQALFLRASLTERMRGALRSGVVGYDPVEVKNLVLYGTRSPEVGAVPSLRLTEAMVAVTRLDTNTPADRIRITVSNYPIIFLTPVLAGQITSAPIIVVQALEK